MTFAEIFSPLTALLRVALSFFVRKAGHFQKRLEAHIVMRGIVSELPDDIPFYVCDDKGVRHKGIYVIGLLLWNKGNQPITHSDFTPSSPLHISVGADAQIVKVNLIPIEDQTSCSTTAVNDTKVSIFFDCLNAKEYLLVSLFVTGNALTQVEVTGRIVGQEISIDHTAEEVRADFGERFVALILLLIIGNVIPELVIGGWLILRQYGSDALLNQPHSIPVYLTLPFSMGVCATLMFLMSRAFRWHERRKFPEGYPLYSDLEPPLLENIKGMFRTLFQGRKQRVSASLFDWGKPVLMPAKKVKRHTIDDWIR